jgi:hypothetical protein
MPNPFIEDLRAEYHERGWPVLIMIGIFAILMAPIFLTIFFWGPLMSLARGGAE